MTEFTESNMARLTGATDEIVREFKWMLVSILAAAAHYRFPIDGEGRITVIVTKERPRTGAIAAVECALGFEMSDTVPQNIRDTINGLFDEGPPPLAEDLH